MLYHLTNDYYINSKKLKNIVLFILLENDTIMIPSYSRIKNIFLNPYTIAVLFLFFIMAVSSMYFFDIDEGVWHIIGTSWSKYSMPPYKYVLDDKAPAIHMVFALSYWLFGLSKFFPRLLGAVCLALCSLVLYKTAFKLRDKSTGLITMTLFLLSSMWIKFDGPVTSHTESFMVLFTSLAFYLVIFSIDKKKTNSYRLNLFLAGLCMGTALNFKQIALFDCAAFFIIFILNNRNNTKKLIFLGSSVMLCGIITAILISIIPLLISGVAITDYLSAVWFNIFSMFLEQKGTASSFKMRIFNFFPAWRSSDIVLFYPLIFLFIIQRKNLLKDRIPFYAILLWLMFAFIGVNSVGFYWGHQFKQILPQLALIGGISLSKLKDYPFARDKQRIVQLSTIFIVLLWLPWVSFTDYMGNKGLWQLKKVGLWIKENSTPEDYIYCYGTISYGYAMLAQAYSERKSPSKYITPFSVELNDCDKVLSDDLITHRPKYILIPERLYRTTPSSLEKILSLFYNYKLTYYSFRVYETK